MMNVPRNISSGTWQMLLKKVIIIAVHSIWMDGAYKMYGWVDDDFIDFWDESWFGYEVNVVYQWIV